MFSLIFQNVLAHLNYIFIVASTVKLQVKEPPVTILIPMCLKKVTSNKSNAKAGDMCGRVPSNVAAQPRRSPRTQRPCWHQGEISFLKPREFKVLPPLTAILGTFEILKTLE